MPELPEVETTCRGLADVLVGKKLLQVKLRRVGMRIPFPPGLSSSMAGCIITDIRRYAKYICIGLDNGCSALAHLGMSGRMVITNSAVEPGIHDHVVFDAENGLRILFNDPRRFGLLTITKTKHMRNHKLLCHLGPDPLTQFFTAESLSQALKNRKLSIKAALLDQTIVSGIGNIYACESLFRAGISPRRMAKSISGKRSVSLVSSIKEVLNEAIKAGGSSVKDYVQPSGELGYFSQNWQVYGREGDYCCCDKGGKRGIRVKRMVQSGRSTFYCSRCQK
jgi:formamidopyrimidine-DNA glycosylase